MENTNTTETTESGAPMTARNVARVAALKSLRYGIELETIGINCRAAAEIIARLTDGVVSPGQTYLGGYVVTMADGRVWGCVRDASIETREYGGGCEVVSPILTWSDMDKVQEIVRALRAAGARVNDSCGMHVHVDGAAFKAQPGKVRNLMALAYRWESVAVNVARVLQHRRGFCQTFPTSTVERFRRLRPSASFDAVRTAWYGRPNVVASHYDHSRYHWINVHALFDKGTIEFRLFNGTVHAGIVKSNVLFALGMAACALSMRSVSFRGQGDSRTLADGRRAVSAHDTRMFLVHVLALVGDEFKTYRKHLAKFIAGQENGTDAQAVAA